MDDRESEKSHSTKEKKKVEYYNDNHDIYFDSSIKMKIWLQVCQYWIKEFVVCDIYDIMRVLALIMPITINKINK